MSLEENTGGDNIYEEWGVVISYNLKVFSYFNVDEFFALEKTVNKSQRPFLWVYDKKNVVLLISI